MKLWWTQMGHWYFEIFQPLAMKVSVPCDSSGVKSNLPRFSCISLPSFELQMKTSIFIFIRSLNPSPLHSVSASLKYLFVNFQEAFFFLSLLLFGVMFFFPLRWNLHFILFFPHLCPFICLAGSWVFPKVLFEWLLK